MPWRRWGRLALWTFLFGYALVMFLFTVLQRYLIYVPTKLSMASAEQTAAKAGFVPWLNPAGQLMGWKLPASSAPVGSVLIFHGNAGWALNRAYMTLPIHDAAPLDVYIFEYPGFGAREGSPGEKNVLSAADEAFVNLPENLPAYLVSESLGAGAAAHLAQTLSGARGGHRDVCALQQARLRRPKPRSVHSGLLFVVGPFQSGGMVERLSRPGQVYHRGRGRNHPAEVSASGFMTDTTGRKFFRSFPGARHADTTPETAGLVARPARLLATARGDESGFSRRKLKSRVTRG